LVGEWLFIWVRSVQRGFFLGLLVVLGAVAWLLVPLGALLVGLVAGSENRSARMLIQGLIEGSLGGLLSWGILLLTPGGFWALPVASVGFGAAGVLVAILEWLVAGDSRFTV
jgi:hypothetical protein